MPDEVANLMLEQFRMIRSEIAELRGEVRDGMAALRGRLDNVETEVRGATYIMTVAVGALLADMKDAKDRLRTLEQTRSE